METRRAAITLALLTAPLAGCAVGTEAPDAVGYVLLDREAQANGELSHGTFRGTPVLPVALDATEPAVFSSSAGRTVVDLQPGMLAWIHGAGGAVEWRALRDEVRDDRLRVHGSRDAAAELARRLAGELIGPVDDGVWTIAAPDVFDRGSFLAPPEGVAEVSPEPLLDLTRLGAPIQKLAVLSDSSAGMPAPVRQASLVGLYTAGDRALFLDATGGYAIEEACSGGALDQGRWRIEGDTVVLEGKGSPMVLAYDATLGDLIADSGERLSSALVDGILAQMSREAP